ncbi:MAG: nucleotidyltransferase domain-containing protein [Planctomycetota bacterium]|jgi:predicted nucleotidyltransferase
MIPEPVRNNIQRVQLACLEAGVKSLWLFGSSARGDWVAETSDIDFLVQLSSTTSKAEQFFKLYRSLAELFHERIDLVSIDGVRNRHFQAELAETRVPLYVAA